MTTLQGEALAGELKNNSQSNGTYEARLNRATLRQPPAGEVIGISSVNGIHAWLGIPYAKSPLGNLRWCAPEPIPTWQGRYEAAKPGTPACQPALTSLEIIGSEDCLYLNIWSPAFAPEAVPQSKERLSVMVWIHGGGNVFGSGNTYDGSILAATQNVIVITFNYRLGLFGWFNHKALQSQSKTPADRSGNYGLLDQIQALKWIRDNIAAFGGDPKRVTIFGESAGACNVLALLVSPVAKGLFHRAIVQSGYAYTPFQARAINYIDDPEPGTSRSFSEIVLQQVIRDGHANNREKVKAFIARVHDAELAHYLRSKSYEDLFLSALDIPDTDPEMRFSRGIPQLMEDGYIIPTGGVLNAINKGDYNRVPIVLGSTRDEMTILMAMYPEPAFPIENHPRFLLAAEYASEMWRALNVNALAELLSKQQKEPVFVYRFDWDQLAPAAWADNLQLGAPHGLDVSFVFGHLDLGPEFEPSLSLITDEKQNSFQSLSRMMMASWAAFATNGTPSLTTTQIDSGWLPWQMAGSAGRNVMLLNAETKLAHLQAPPCSVSGVLDNLAVDSRFMNMVDRTKFLHDLVAVRGAGLSEHDYDRFRMRHGL